MQKEQKNDFVVQGSILAIAGLIVRFIGLIYRVPLTRIIGREGMAYYNSAYEYYNIALLLSSYSIPVAVSKLVSARETKREYKTSFRIFLIAMIFAIAVGLAAFLVLFFGADFFAGLSGWPSAAVPLRVLAPTILVFAIMGVFRGFFQGKKTMVPTAISQVIEQIINAVVSVVAATLLVNAYVDTAQAASYGAAGGTLGTLAGAVAGLLTLVYIFLRERKYYKRRLLRDETGVRDGNGIILKAIVLTMLPIILSQTVYQISGVIDNTMFGLIMDSKGVIEKERALLWEAYSNKYKWLINVPIAISSAFGVSIVPSLTATHTEGNMELVRKKIASGIKLNMIIAIPAAVGLAVLSDPLLSLLFKGSADSLSPKLMQLGAVAIVFFSYSTITNGVLQGINHMKDPVIHASVSLGIHVVLNFVLIKVLDFSAYGLVIGNTVYALTVSVMNFLAIRKKAEYKQEIKRAFLLPLLASLVMGLITFGIYYLISLTGLIAVAVIVSMLIAIAVYAVLIAVFGIFTEEETNELPLGLGKYVRKLKSKIGFTIFKQAD